ncbi:hypothetical protein H4R34_002788 [Dimargaris verticillata]|uniref:Uncharacterized protein n=1 Tax=Dimargaris verticillata TaxID=2761393 RepID=A0A9W8B7E5_9FUNG|nr:hypothetical protein H4R34_002788 [Dimargaris verticillata]
MYNHFSHIPSPQSSSSTSNPGMSQGMPQRNGLNTPVMDQSVPLPHTPSLGIEALNVGSAQPVSTAYKFSPQQQWVSPNRPTASQPQLLSEFTPSPETNVLSLGPQSTLTPSQPTPHPSHTSPWPPGLSSTLSQATLAHALAMANRNDLQTLTGHRDVRQALPHGSMPTYGNELAQILSPQATAGSVQFSGNTSNQAYQPNIFLSTPSGHWNQNQMMSTSAGHQGLPAWPSPNPMFTPPSAQAPNPIFPTSMAAALAMPNGGMPGSPVLALPYNEMATDPRMLLPGSAWPSPAMQSTTMNPTQNLPSFHFATQSSANAAAIAHMQQQLFLRQQQAQALALAGLGHVGTGAYLAGATRRPMASSAPATLSPPTKRQRTSGISFGAVSKRQSKTATARKQPPTPTKICQRPQTAATPPSTALALPPTPMVTTTAPSMAIPALPNISTPLPVESVTRSIPVPCPPNALQPPLANPLSVPLSQPLYHTFKTATLPAPVSATAGPSPAFSASSSQHLSPGAANMKMKKTFAPTPRRPRSKLALDRLHKMQVSVPVDIAKPRPKAASPLPQPMDSAPGTLPSQPVASSHRLEPKIVAPPEPSPLVLISSAAADARDYLVSTGPPANKLLEPLVSTADLPSTLNEVPQSHHLLDPSFPLGDGNIALFHFGDTTVSATTSTPSFASFAALMAGDTETNEGKPLTPTVSLSTTVSASMKPSEPLLDPSLCFSFDTDARATLTTTTSENHPAITTSTAPAITDQIECAGTDSLLDLDRQLEDIAEFLEKDVDLLTPVASKSMITTSTTHTDTANFSVSFSRPLTFPLTSPHHSMATQGDSADAVLLTDADSLLGLVTCSMDPPSAGALDSPAANSVSRKGNTRLQGLQLPDLVLEEGMGVLDSDNEDP